MSDKKEKKLKRKREEEEEKEEPLEIDLEKPTPLSKKQLRLQKKGKDVNLKLSKKQKLLQESTADLEEAEEETKEEEGEDGKEKKKKSEFGVWIGNLSFDTTPDQLKEFFVSNTKDLKKLDETADGEGSKITERDITRVNMPKSKFKKTENKGFAYVDFRDKKQLTAALGLSEQSLNRRNVLIKDANSFDGRPEKPAKNPLVNLHSGPGNDNPPTRILFVGNLSYDVTELDLEKHFQHCGRITKIRMATFEDSGKCKGFAFVDFLNPDGPTYALKDRSISHLNGRPLKMQYGEDRSKRTQKDKMMTRLKASGVDVSQQEQNQQSQEQEKPAREYHDNTKKEWSSSKATFKPKPRRANESNQRVKPGLALATAQRAKVSIVESKGKKIVFD